MTAIRLPTFALGDIALTLRTSDAARPDIGPVVEAAQSGDVSAFARLYREHMGRVYALCLRLTADKTHAEVLTQDVFVRAWERLGSYRGESSFAAWLRRVTINVVLAERRSSSRRTRRVVTTDDETLALASLPRADDVEIDLDRAIARLPEGARTVSAAGQEVYVLALRALEASFAEQRRFLPGDAVHRIEASLAVLDDAISATKKALEATPGSPELEGQLRDEYEQKIRALTDIVDLARGSSDPFGSRPFRATSRSAAGPAR